MAKEIERTGQPVIQNIGKAEAALKKQADEQAPYDRETKRIDEQTRRDVAERVRRGGEGEAK